MMCNLIIVIKGFPKGCGIRKLVATKDEMYKDVNLSWNLELRGGGGSHGDYFITYLG